MASIRYFSVNTDLFYRINCLEQEFCVHRISVEVNGTFTFPLLQDSHKISGWMFLLAKSCWMF